MIDHQDAVTKFFDILHVMARQQRDDAMLLVINAQKLADTFLAYHIQADCRFIQKKDARFVNERGDQFHLHPFA